VRAEDGDVEPEATTSGISALGRALGASTEVDLTRPYGRRLRLPAGFSLIHRIKRDVSQEGGR
jgi:hypothetical protein